VSDDEAIQGANAVVELDESELWGPSPRGRLLSNGCYTTLITNAGTGFSRFGEIMLNRWTGDRVEDGEGYFVYLRDRATGEVCSFGFQPTGVAAGGVSDSSYTARFCPGDVCFTRIQGNLEMQMEVSVAPDANVEFRRCTVHNHSPVRRRLDLTSCLDVVLNARAAHAAHPAFSKLFVQTEYALDQRALLAVRRPRASGDFAGSMIHWPVTEGKNGNSGDFPPHYETDRFIFLGRGRDLRAPRAFDGDGVLSGTVGNVLDPVLSLRVPLNLEPGAKGTVVFALAAADSKDQCRSLCAANGTMDAVEQAFRRARQHERDVEAELGITSADAHRFQDMATDMLYGNPQIRACEAVLHCPLEHARLADLGLAGSRPLVLVQADRQERLQHVDRYVRAHAYWAGHGLSVDLVFLTDMAAGDEPDLAASLSSWGGRIMGTGAIIILARDRLTPDIGVFLRAKAAMVVGADGVVGAAPQQASGREASNRHPLRARAAEGAFGGDASQRVLCDEPLLFDNGHGGFSRDGSEYVIRIGGPSATPLPPLPWTHVIANQSFGFLISETGAGCTWAINSRLNRLTPWYNDPVADPHGEAIYIRDEAARTFWSPLPGPVVPAGDGVAAREVRYGFGSCRFIYDDADLPQEVTVYVPREDPVKVTEIRLRNAGDRTRTLSVLVYYRLVLGSDCAEATPFVSTRIDYELAAAFAHNPLRQDFATRVAFVAVAEPDLAAVCSFTTDRATFIGRNESPRNPAAVVADATLDGRDGVGLDPCFALQIPVRLEPGASTTCTVLLGEADSEATARALVCRYREPHTAQRHLEAVTVWWRDLVSMVRVATPSTAIDLMINGWLLYQNLSCRIWGRSAFYQSGGAFGYRDQAQDSAAFVHTLPDLTRQQILLHAAHQFVEGDVMHWWHPPQSRGMRTRFSDDLLWLPFLTVKYLEATADLGILDETAPYLRARLLRPGEDEVYLLPEDSGESGSLYDHCCRALDRSLTKGAHGLPLMGTGDWNDGMNRVGREGRGESVWLGFFLYFILTRFIPLCRRRGDDARADDYESYRTHLVEALNDGGWDGAWYRRAYYDDGTPLGSAEGDECRIDALVQAWAVISGAAPPDRIEQALDALERHLVSERDGLIRLLTPPFDRTPHDPGYIKGYVPGVRENGGQYTHAALWAIQALAEAGRRDRAATLLEMISPVTRGGSAEAAARYKVEPYVIAADVYGTEPHVGRGGWTWYTGSAAWMYRVFLESLLGVRMEEGTILVVRPRLPAAWSEARIDWTLPDGTVYRITLRHGGERRSQVLFASVDGTPADIREGAARLRLKRDSHCHEVIIDLG
jgi:cellobiose phosphorylase